MSFRKKKIEKLLGEILVEKNIITAPQLKIALEIHSNEGGLLGEIIVKKGYAKEEEIAQCVSSQYGFPYLPLDNYDITAAVISLIPLNVTQHYCLIPIDKIGNTLTIAMANPVNIEAIEDLEDITSLNIQIFISTASDIRNAILRYYKN